MTFTNETKKKKKKQQRDRILFFFISIEKCLIYHSRLYQVTFLDTHVLIRHSLRPQACVSCTCGICNALAMDIDTQNDARILEQFWSSCIIAKQCGMIFRACPFRFISYDYTSLHSLPIPRLFPLAPVKCCSCIVRNSQCKLILRESHELYRVIIRRQRAS